MDHILRSTELVKTKSLEPGRAICSESKCDFPLILSILIDSYYLHYLNRSIEKSLLQGLISLSLTFLFASSKVDFIFILYFHDQSGSITVYFLGNIASLSRFQTVNILSVSLHFQLHVISPHKLSPIVSHTLW